MAGLGYGWPLLEVGDLTATANYSSASNQYRIVESTAAGSFSITNAAGQWCKGVLMDRPSSGEHGKVAVFGVAPVRVLSTAHSAIGLGAKIMCSTNGGGLPSTGGPTQYVLGRAWSTLSANTTGIVMVCLTHEGAGSTGGVAAA